MSAPSQSPRKLDTTHTYDSSALSPTSLSPSSRPQFPFPHYDASSPHALWRPTRRGSMGSIASITSSIGGILDTAVQPAPGPLNDLSHNAISSLLSPPIARTGLIPHSALLPSTAHRAPTVRDIPPVTLTTVPHVETSVFSSYLTRISALYDNFQSAKAAADDGASTIFNNNEATTILANGPDHQRMRTRDESAPSTPTAVRRQSNYSQSPATPEFRRKSSGTSRSKRDPYAATPLSTIPAVYLEENFQLENPRTFDVVSERSEVIPPPVLSQDNAANANGSLKVPVVSSRRALHTNAILQEKLSWYMDTVEVHLISAISTASQSFFAALGSLKELNSEASDLITQIKKLRSTLAQLDKDMAIGGLQVVNMRQRRENVRKLASAVRQLCDAVEDATRCEELVEVGKLDEAAKGLDELEALILGSLPNSLDQDREYQRIDLRQLKALDGISEGIDQLRLRIGRGFEARFLDALLTDLRQHVENVPSRETIQRWANASQRARGGHGATKSSVPLYMKTNTELRPALVAALAGLSSTGQATRAATAYREAIMREIKMLIRRSLPSSSDDDAESTTSINTRGGRKLSQQEKSAILARNLRTLDAEAAEELLVKVYTNVGEALRRLGFQIKVLLDVTISMDPSTASNGVFSRTSVVKDPNGQTTQVRDEVIQALDLSAILEQAVDVIQTQITKVLKVRTDQNCGLSLSDFLRYFTLNRLFADECEAVSGRSGDGLKDVVNAQVKGFLQVMSEMERQRVIQTLEADRWEAKDFGPVEETILNRVLEGMTRTPKAWTAYTGLWEEEAASATTNGTFHTNGESNPTALPEKTRTAFIDEQRFILVASAIAALHTIDRYSTLIAAIPSLTAEASLKLIDYLKIFNSRCQQLVLGAGATRSAGLKNITTKHLALASQACSFIVALVPYMREYVRRQAPAAAGAVLPEFDKVKRVFQEHQSSVREKLVEIMSQRSSAHINAMRRIDWDALPEGAGVNPYMESLTRETGTLHKVLARHVAEIELRMIMMPIFGHYSQEWTKGFREAGVRTQMGKANMLRDVEYLSARFGRMEDSGDLGTNLVQLVKDKQVQIPAPTRASREIVRASTELRLPASSTPQALAPAKAEASTPGDTPKTSAETQQSFPLVTGHEVEPRSAALIEPENNAGAEEPEVQLAALNEGLLPSVPARLTETVPRASAETIEPKKAQLDRGTSGAAALDEAEAEANDGGAEGQA